MEKTKHAMSLMNDFRDFVLRGNVVDLAVGVVIGASFGTVVNALVADLLTPLIAAIAHIPDFSGLAFTLNGSKFMIGHLINAVISFILVAGAIFFFVIKPMNLLIERAKRTFPSEAVTKKCLECLFEIPSAAKRCAHCTTSQL